MLDPVEQWISNVRSKPRSLDLVEGLIPAHPGISLLGGRTGIGKTNLAFQLMYSVASGADFLGRKTQKGSVGYLGFEGSQEKMADRLEKIGQNFSTWQGKVHFAMRAPRRLDQTFVELQQLFQGMQFIILDPLKYLVGGDYTKPADAQRFLALLFDLSQSVGAHILVCHHIRKPDKRTLIEPGELYELKGAGDYVEAATTVMLLERERQRHHVSGGFAPVNPDHSELHFAKTRDAIELIDPITLAFDRQKLMFKWRPLT